MNAEPPSAVAPPVEPVRPPTPLVPIALGIVAGINIDAMIAPPFVSSVVLFGIALWLVSSLGPRKSYFRHAKLRFALATFIAAASLGIMRHAAAQRYYQSDHIARHAMAEPSIVKVTGNILSPPRIHEPRDDVPRAYETPPKTRFLLNVDSIFGSDGPLASTGRAIVTVKEPILDLTEGTRIELTGWLYRIPPPQNPGSYDWAAHHRRDGIFVGLSTDHAAALTILQRPAGRGFKPYIDSARQWLNRYLIESSFPDDEESAGVVAAMVLGQRSVVSRTLNDAFVRTGNVHYLAASGMNVAWLALVGWTIARLCNINYRPTAVFIAFLIVAFVLLAEPQPSILRAGIVGLVACGTIFFRGRFNSVNSIALSAIILLLIDPSDWFRPGFQLTFLATIGLVHVYPPVSNYIAEVLIKRNRLNLAKHFIVGSSSDTMELLSLAPESSIHPLASRILTVTVQVLVLSVSEWIITAPLSCYYFNTFAPWGAIGTFLVSPLAMLTAFIGFVTILAGLLLPSLAIILGPLLKLSCAIMIVFVQWLAKWPGTSMGGRSPSIVWLVAVYATLIVWIYCPFKLRHRLRNPLRILTPVLIIWWIAAPWFAQRLDGGLRVWMLAVGNGTATVIELPNGKTLLYDFGTRSSFDAGVVGLDFLRHRGIDNIDTVFISHADFDHYGAVEMIAKQVPIGRIVINDQFESFAEDRSPSWHFLRAIEREGLPVERISGDASIDVCEGVKLDVVWPPSRRDLASPTDNDASMVVRIEFQGKSVLLTGDIAEWAIGGLIGEFKKGTNQSLSADVLALPHHGSVVTTTGDFIERVNPRIAIRSTGQRRPLTINGIEELVGPQRQYFTTADDGCIVVTIKNGEVTAERAMP